MAVPEFVVSDGKVGIGETEKLSRLTVKAEASRTLTGTVSKTGTSEDLTGVGTQFLNELGIGDRIVVPGGGGDESRVVVSIASNTALTVDAAFDNTASGQTATAFPAIARFEDAAGIVRLLLTDQGFLAFGLPPTIGISVNEERTFGVGEVSASGDEGAIFNYLELSENSVRFQNGIRYEGVVTIDANTTLDEGVFTVLVDAGSGGVTVTLPPVEDGREYWVYKIDGAGNVTVTPDGSDLINGVNTSKTVSAQWSAIRLLGNEAVGWTALAATGA